MVHLIAVAVEHPGQLPLQPIPAARLDAERLYRTLASAAGSLFEDTRSMCLIDPTATEARMALARTASQLNSGDTLIIFFSGHGQIANGRLFLAFADATPDGRGQVGVPELGEWLIQFSVERVVILDCCHSGAALGLANLGDIYERARTAVLTSTDAFRRSSFSESGSHFTSALCDAIIRVESERAPLSLNRLVRLMTDQSSDVPLLNLPQGREDVVISTGADAVSVPESFVQDFVSKILESPLVERQYLWFDLIRAPLRSRYATLERYLDGAFPSEPSWLVRRAIGTALGSCEPVGRAWRKLCISLITSADWMRSCIGLIAARRVLDDGEIRTATIAAITPASQVDSAWLASLYLADAGIDARTEVLQSRLRLSEWGTIDILVRWALHRSDEAAAASEIISSVPPSSLSAAATHCRLLGHVPACLRELSYDAALCNSRLARFLYSAERRGRTTAPELRSLLSAIYGNWRDQIHGDVREWVRNQTAKDASAELDMCSKLPAVEARMAIFQDLAHDPGLVREFETSLRWGLTDPHPWTRREALRAFRRAPEVAANALNGLADISSYPGLLDLYLECSQHGLSPEEIIATQDVPPKAIEAFRWATGLFEQARFDHAISQPTAADCVVRGGS